MRGKLKWLWRETYVQLQRTVTEFTEDQCTVMAAALAYYAIFSLAPLMVIAISLAGWIFDPSDVQGEVRRQIKTVAGSEAADEINTLITRASARENGWLAGAAGGVALLLGASGVFLQIQTALNRAWDVTVDPERSGIKAFITQRLLSFSMVLVITFLLLTSLTVSAALSAFGEFIADLTPPGVGQTLIFALHSLFSFGVIVLLFAAMFKFLPDAEVPWKSVWFGATVTALLFVIGKVALSIGLSQSNLATTFGQAGSLAFILTWIYYSSMIFLLGAEFSQVWARRRGWDMRPVEGAVKVTNKPTDIEYERPEEAAD